MSFYAFIEPMNFLCQNWTAPMVGAMFMPKMGKLGGMVKLYRFMSAREFSRFTAGVEMCPRGRFQARTSSVDYCFLGEETVFVNCDGITLSFRPEDCLRFMRGVVTDDVLVEFDVADPSIVMESDGCYADPTSPYWDDCIVIDEYCVLNDDYNRDNLVPVRYAIPDGKNTVWYQVY